jgi:hypothetical protein
MIFFISFEFLAYVKLLIEKLPDVGFINPQSIEIKVVFPAPFGPNNPKIWPSFTANEKSTKENVSASLYFFESWFI